MTPNDERAQIRAEAVRECVAKLREAQSGWEAKVEGFRNLGNYGPYLGSPNYADAAYVVSTLLRPDPAEASEPLQSARPYVAPVDHGPGAAAHGESGTLHEPTVSDVVAEIADWLEAEYPDSISAELVRKQWLKPDPAKELVEEIEPALFQFLHGHDPMCGFSDCERTAREIAPLIVGWLIDKGRHTP